MVVLNVVETSPKVAELIISKIWKKLDMYIDKNSGLECYPTFIAYSKWIKENNLPDNDESIEKYNRMIEEYVNKHFYTE